MVKVRCPESDTGAAAEDFGEALAEAAVVVRTAVGVAVPAVDADGAAPVGIAAPLLATAVPLAAAPVAPAAPALTCATAPPDDIT